MTPEDKQEIKEAMIAGIREGFHGSELSAEETQKREFYVPPVQHHRDHSFIDAFIRFVDEGRMIVFKTIIRGFVILALAAMAIGGYVLFMRQGAGLGGG